MSSEQRFDGLVLVTPSRQAWAWIGYRFVPSIVRGQPERLERWSSTCAGCGRPMVVAARMLADWRQTFFERRYIERGALEIRIAVSLAPRPIPALEVTECRACRQRDQRDAEAEVAAQ